MRYFAESDRFHGASAREAQEADLFFEDLVGAQSPVPWGRGEAAAPASTEWDEEAPTIRLSTAEVLVCVGGMINATVTATTTNTTSVTWAVDDTSRVRLRPSGNTVTISGLRPGVTTLRATATGADGTATATARVLVIFVEMTLRNSRTIEASPENEDEAAERAAAGGTNALGPLAMGTGRGDFPGTAYTSPIMMIGTVFPAEAATRFTFRWRRLITRRSWRIRRDATGARWVVTFRSARGPLDDDTGAAAFNDATPSATNRRIYIYDNSAIVLAGEPHAVGEFVHEKKDFIYQVQVRLNGRWTIASGLHVGQVITARRTATTGTVSGDWTGVENSNALRNLNDRITVAEVRAIVGGADPIDIAAGANP